MQQFSEKSNISRPKEMKVKAYIWIMSLIDGDKRVCVDIWPSEILLLLFHDLLVHTCHFCNLRELFYNLVNKCILNC